MSQQEPDQNDKKQNLDSTVVMNGFGVFQHVLIDDHFGAMLTIEQKNHFYDALIETLYQFHLMKNNPVHIEFLSEETGFDLQYAFQVMESKPLIITSDGDDIELDYDYDDNNVLQCSYINITESSICTESSNSLLFTLGHEIGHALFHAAKTSTFRTKKHRKYGFTPRPDYTDNHHQNHTLEISADKIGIFISPEVDLHESLHGPSSIAPRIIPIAIDQPVPLTGKLISKFYQLRDDVVNTLYGGTPTQRKLNTMFNMSSAVTHPADYTRAVKSIEFRDRMKKLNHNQ